MSASSRSSALALFIGFAGALLGIGGGFIVVPALLYVFRVPTNVVVGTSQFQIVCTTLVALILHAVTNQAVDMVLAILLIVGGVFGAQFGARMGRHLRAELFRFLLAILLLAVGLRFGLELVLQAERAVLDLRAGGAHSEGARPPPVAAPARPAAPARAETLITSLSNHRVLINSNYTGTQIAVFGAIERDAQTVARATAYDVVVTVRGPRQFLTVREKERLGPIWINQEQQKFPTAPAYLNVLTSRPIAEITSEQLRQRQKVGLSAIVNAPDFTLDRGGADRPFREALLRLKAAGRALSPGRARRDLPDARRSSAPASPLPATAPPGNYDVDVTLFADTVILARTQTHFELVKTGFEEQVGVIARDWSLAYGLATAAIALFFGWIANAIFRRD